MGTPSVVHKLALCESDDVGDGTRVWAFAHVMAGARLGRNCNICDHAFVESGAVLGDNVTVKNGVSVWDGVTAGNDVFIGPNAVFTNDLMPRAAVKRPSEEWLVRTSLGDGVTIGANATIVCGVVIGEGAFVGAGSVVVHDVPSYALVVGNPARQIGWACRCGTRLDDSLVCGACGTTYTQGGVRSGAGLVAVQDVVVIGGGIVGLAVARAVMSARPGCSVTVVEKEAAVAVHQTGHNSGVLHSGIYYRPGSLKARTTFAGRRAMLEFCAEHEIPVNVCGKVVVATREDELGRLAVLEERGQANAVPLERIGPERLREIEPHAAGIAALHVPGVAALDFGRVSRAMAADIAAAGGEVKLGVAVSGVEEHHGAARVTTGAGAFEARVVVNCAGLHSDRVARLHDSTLTDVRIIPFRGEYYELVDGRRDLVRSAIYPVPDPALPFLGVHFTRMIDGSVHAGPNAVLALAREGYRWRDVRGRDVAELVRFRGTWGVARHHWRIEVGEVTRSLSRRAFVRGLQRLVPAVEGKDLVRAGSGVRAQAVDRTGALLDDFVLRESARVVDVVNAPSPAATASLEIGRVVAELVTTRLEDSGAC